MISKFASSPLGTVAKDTVKQKLLEFAISKSMDVAKNKLEAKKGKGVGSKKSTKKRLPRANKGGTPSYNKNAVVTVEKHMPFKQNQIKPARKVDFKFH